ncbi:MAG: hypothetical protein PVH19_00355 [Planctomycetia bacterium]|jgi:hypothetical protein
MIKKYKNIGILTGAPGAILHTIGNVKGTDILTEARGCPQFLPSQQIPLFLVSIFAFIVGGILLTVSFAYFAKAKKRSPWWCLWAFWSLFGFLVLIGIVVMMLLADHDVGEEGGNEEEIAMLDPIPEQQEG